MTKVEREKRLVERWLQRQPADKRTTIDVLAFYGWVQENHPTLFYGMAGDPYQHLHTILRNHIQE